MAVFLINICKFNNCGIIFPSLGDLIQHIEDTHIDYDPKVVEQKEQAQPTCLPLSYVLRFITDAARKESPFLGSTGADLKRKLAIKHHSYSMSSSNRSNTPTGSELDEDEMIISESEDSNDSWTTEEFSSEFIMRYGSRHSGSGNGTPGNEKPFACPVPGCKKRYKNVNGIKYHSKNGHKKDGKVRKGYKCHCGKSYKTAQGLKSHALSAHNSSPDNITNNTNVRSLSPSQSAGSLSPSSVSNLSGSSGGSSFTNLTNNLNNINNNSNSISQSQQTHQQHQINSNSSSVTNILTASSLSSSLSSASINQSNNSNNNHNNTSNLLRSNIGLISIKSTSGSSAIVKSVNSTTTGNLLAANVTANKILKLTATVAAAAAANNIILNNNNNLNNNVDIVQQQQQQQQQKHENIKIKFDSSTSTAPTKLTLPGLVNLGILTPATSPKIQQQQQHSTFVTASHLQQQQQQQQQINAGTNTSSSIIINNQGNININSNLDNLPLTPISPNIQNNNNHNNKSSASVVSVATATSGGSITINNHNSNNNLSVVSSSTSSTTTTIVGNGFTLTTSNITNNNGVLLNDKINGDDT